MKLIVENLNKTYGKKRALKNFSAVFSPGIYGLLGPNGAGKSTLMNILSENLTADSGVVQLEPGGRVLDSLGYMPQQQALYDDFSARSFLYYMASLKRIRHPKAEIESLLEVVNLAEVAHKKMGAFSGGMKQRILLAQSMLGSPKILLLDEPTAGLDPIERIRIRNFISAFAKDKVILLATHVVSDIEFIARQILILHQGVLLGMYTPGEWLAQLEGKVFEHTVADEEIQAYQQRYQISNLFRQTQGVSLRLVTDTPPKGAAQVKPMLEDVYLYTQNAQ